MLNPKQSSNQYRTVIILGATIFAVSIIAGVIIAIILIVRAIRKDQVEPIPVIQGVYLYFSDPSSKPIVYTDTTYIPDLMALPLIDSFAVYGGGWTISLYSKPYFTGDNSIIFDTSENKTSLDDWQSLRLVKGASKPRDVLIAVYPDPDYQGTYIPISSAGEYTIDQLGLTKISSISFPVWPAEIGLYSGDNLVKTISQSTPTLISEDKVINKIIVKDLSYSTLSPSV